MSRVRFAKIIVVACVLLVGTLHAGTGVRRPNVIFIFADDLGWGDVGFAWQNARAERLPRIRTPHLDRLASGGTALSNHYCCAPVCAPSRASILTGLPQGRCSLRDNCIDRPFTETNTIGTVMRAAGYATWAVGKWGVAGARVEGFPRRRGRGTLRADEVARLHAVRVSVERRNGGVP